jgi:hypothetical protein
MEYRPYLSVPLTLDRLQDMYWRIDMAADRIKVLQDQVKVLEASACNCKAQDFVHD